MTTFLLVRHCALDALNRYLAGRAPGEHLNDAGRAQVQRLANQFAGVTLDAVFSSPLERARETSAAFAACVQGGVQYVDDLFEVDLGEWTGKTFDELARDPRWTSFNTRREITQIPGGEMILDVQVRVVRFLQQQAARFPDGRVAIVSHGDVLRAAIAYYLGLPIDHMLRFDISPGSISVLRVNADGAHLLCLNSRDVSDEQLQA
jgi:broad specificity phosphatase PhoE